MDGSLYSNFRHISCSQQNAGCKLAVGRIAPLPDEILDSVSKFDLKPHRAARSGGASKRGEFAPTRPSTCSSFTKSHMLSAGCAREQGTGDVDTGALPVQSPHFHDAL